ncbi:MAG TPA: FMN-binding protein [Gaiellaceae bacterium]|nr:FMN-binding protein [Gaiellaceae bacterium]
MALPALGSAGVARGATASATPKVLPVKRITTKTFAGITAQANQWGTVEITVTLRTTTITTGTKKKVTRKYTNLGGHYSYHTARSQFIMSQSLPILRQEFLQAQTAGGVQMVSGATYTSQAFMQSLQSALLKATSAKTS